VGDLFLEEVKKRQPKIFLEVGVFHGVTARNICELLYSIHGSEFKYIGIDLFEENNENKDEIIPNRKFSNPFKNFYFNYIKRQNPYSKEAVENLLYKFNKNVTLLKGNSNKILKNIDMSKIDYVFIDGGHEYKTVMNDLINSQDVVLNGGTILCDDYDLSQAPGVKKAIDDFIQKNSFNCEIIHNYRFAKIEK